MEFGDPSVAPTWTAANHPVKSSLDSLLWTVSASTSFCIYPIPQLFVDQLNLELQIKREQCPLPKLLILTGIFQVKTEALRNEASVSRDKFSIEKPGLLIETTFP